ncbi:MAG: hypothetical protein M3R37_03950 [Actinomycetota bacterium]|nr:hypothetical protein [Actinomycetota bacterium]
MLDNAVWQAVGATGQDFVPHFVPTSAHPTGSQSTEAAKQSSALSDRISLSDGYKPQGMAVGAGALWVTIGYGELGALKSTGKGPTRILSSTFVVSRLIRATVPRSPRLAGVGHPERPCADPKQKRLPAERHNVFVERLCVDTCDLLVEVEGNPDVPLTVGN